MAFDITPYVDKTPAEVRALCRDGVIDFPTAGCAVVTAQAKPCNPASGIRSRFRRICKKESISLSDS